MEIFNTSWSALFLLLLLPDLVRVHPIERNAELVNWWCLIRTKSIERECRGGEMTADSEEYSCNRQRFMGERRRRRKASFINISLSFYLASYLPCPQHHNHHSTPFAAADVLREERNERVRARNCSLWKHSADGGWMDGGIEREWQIVLNIVTGGIIKSWTLFWGSIHPSDTMTAMMMVRLWWWRGPE